MNTYWNHFIRQAFKLLFLSLASFPLMAQCDDTSVEVSNGNIIITGLDAAPISQAKIFNPNWTVAFECSGNCNAMELIPLPEGTYYVKVKLYNASWQSLCETADYYTVTSTTPCNNITDQQKQIERSTLIELFQASPGNSLGNEWTALATETACDVCQLPGVTCNDNGYVSMLKLLEKDLSALPASLSNLTSLEILDLYGNQLTALPESIVTMLSMQKLYASNNQLTSIPEDIGNLTNLTLLFIFQNQITTVPLSVGNLTNLEFFCIYDNPINCLPVELGNICGALVPQGLMATPVGEELTWDEFCASPQDVCVDMGGINCDNIVIEAVSGGISVDGLDLAPVTALRIMDNSWSTVYSCQNNCDAEANVSLPLGLYYVKVKYYDASWQLVCEILEDVLLEDVGCVPGSTCDDGDPCTDDDQLTQDCLCVGNPQLDMDGDGYCASLDCDDDDANNFPKNPGTACDDNNINTENDQIQEDGCTCIGTPVISQCYTVITNKDSIGLQGLDAPHVIVKLFNPDWSLYFQCSDDCESPQWITELPNGIYYLNVVQYNSSWQLTCGNTEYITITDGFDNDTADESSNEQLNNNDAEYDFTLFPNPTAGVININLQDLNGQAAIVQVYNLLGNLIAEKHISEITQTSLSFNLRKEASGIYTVSIKPENGKRITKKFVVNRL